MSIVVACPYCQTRYNLPEKFEGKKVKCKSCGKPFSVTVGENRAKKLNVKRADQQQQLDPSELERMGIGAIKPKIEPFTDVAVGGPDPLQNHVIQDPGFDVGAANPSRPSKGNSTKSNDDAYAAAVSNPYISTAPKPTSIASDASEKSGGKISDELIKIASYQKVLVICVLVYLCMVAVNLGTIPLRMAIGESFDLIIGLILLPIVLGLIITGAVFVVLLALKVYHPAVGVLMGILSLTPCIGLIILLIVNAKATSILKSNGIKVGMMGANVKRMKNG